MGSKKPQYVTVKEAASPATNDSTATLKAAIASQPLAQLK
jgi:hypothetical protein